MQWGNVRVLNWSKHSTWHWWVCALIFKHTIGIGTVAAGAAMAATLFRPEKLIIHNSAWRHCIIKFVIVAIFRGGALTTWIVYVQRYCWSNESLRTESSRLPVTVPHQPKSFCFPKREFGKKSVVTMNFQSSWSNRWSWLRNEFVGPSKHNQTLFGKFLPTD